MSPCFRVFLVSLTLSLFPSRGYLGKIVYVPGLNFQTNASCSLPTAADGHVPRVAFEKCVPLCSAPSAPLPSHTHTHPTHAYTHKHVHTHIHMHAYTHITHTYMCTHTHIHTHKKHTCTHTHMHTRMCTHTYLHTHIHACTHTLPMQK